MKLHNLTIENFRSFDHFTLNNLGRVNLLVGTNNSGKTMVLEAAFILVSDQKLSALASIMSRRGEITSEGSQSGLDVRRLFRNHRLDLGSRFRIQANSGSTSLESSISIESTFDLLTESNPAQLLDDSFIGSPREELRSSQSLAVRWKPEAERPSNKTLIYAPLQGDGSLALSELNARVRRTFRVEETTPIRLINAASLSSHSVKSLYESLVLTPKEELVLEALKIIEPDIERIAAGTIGINRAVGLDSSEVAGPRGILIRLAGVEERIPIGSMGDGIWRMLGLALAVVHSQNGILLVDEIDTGLHYSVMGEMWRFLNECSTRFNVQIIATTHSRDCYQSLAEICREDVLDSSDVTIQRIDRKRAEAVAYSEAAIIAAAERDVEVR